MPESHQKRMFNFLLGSSRPIFAVVTKDRSRYYNSVDTPAQWQPSSPLIERQRLAPLEEVQLRSACKLLYDSVMKSETTRATPHPEWLHPAERTGQRILVQPQSELSPPFSLELVKADFRFQSGDESLSILDKITNDNLEVTPREETKTFPARCISSSKPTITGLLMTPEDKEPVHYEAIPIFDLGSPAESLSSYVQSSNSFSLTQLANQITKLEQQEQIGRFSPLERGKKAPKEVETEHPVLRENAELIAGLKSPAQMSTQPPSQSVPMTNPSATFGVHIEQFHQSGSDDKKPNPSHTSRDHHETKSRSNLSDSSGLHNVHVIQLGVDQQHDEDHLAVDSHGNDHASDQVVRQVTQANENGPNQSSSLLIASPLLLRSPSFSRPQAVSRPASERKLHQGPVPCFETSEKIPETLRNSWQSGQSTESPDSPPLSRDSDCFGLDIVSRPHPAGKAGSVAVIVDSDGMEYKMTEPEERHRYFDLQRAVMEKMFTGAIRAYTNDPEAPTLTDECISVKKNRSQVSEVSASTHECTTESTGNDPIKIASSNPAPVRGEEYSNKANSLHPTMPVRKYGLLRKLSILSLNKRKSRSPATSNSSNMVGISRIVKAS